MQFRKSSHSAIRSWPGVSHLHWLLSQIVCNEGCRCLGSCGSKRSKRVRLEPATAIQGKRLQYHSARSPKKLGLIMNPVESLSRFLLWPLLPGGICVSREGGALPVGRLTPVPSARWSSIRVIRPSRNTLFFFLSSSLSSIPLFSVSLCLSLSQSLAICCVSCHPVLLLLFATTTYCEAIRCDSSLPLFLGPLLHVSPRFIGLMISCETDGYGFSQAARKEAV